MPLTGLLGPHSLTNEEIDAHVKKNVPGAFAVGIERDERFYILKVSRSDADLNGRLHDHVKIYDVFKFIELATPEEAFNKECQLYHDFEPRDNDYHPKPPEGTEIKCPICEGEETEPKRGFKKFL